jgi:hypothetical protein
MVRKILPREEKLLELLINRASLTLSVGWEKNLLVEMFNDGLNRLLTLYPKGYKEEGRKFGKDAGQVEFLDVDGVTVNVSLYLDKNGDLFELDMWKTNDTPLIEIPDVSDMKNIKTK